jgi:hypothetical protein
VLQNCDVGFLGLLGYAGGSAAQVILGYLHAQRAWAIAGAALNLVFIAAISSAVFGEDTYVGDGSSDWSNRGTGPHAIYALAIAGALAVAALFVVLAARRRPPAITRLLLRLSGIGNLIVGYVVLFAFDNN